MFSRLSKTLPRFARMFSQAKVDPPKVKVEAPKAKVIPPQPPKKSSCGCWTWVGVSALLIGGGAYYVHSDCKSDKKCYICKNLCGGKPEVKPVPKPAPKPIEAPKPVEVKPVEVKPVEVKPVVPAPVEKPKEEVKKH